MVDPWLLVATASLAVLWLASLLLVRWWTRRQVLRRLTAVPLTGEDISLPFPDLRPEDRQALQVVRDYRRRYLLNFRLKTEFTFRILVNLSLDLIQQVAAVYHPDEERPELQASLHQLINLNSRISLKLQDLLASLPLRALKDIKLQTVLTCHDLYTLCVSHPVYQFLRRHRLDKVVQWGWMLKNIASPWYWGRRFAYSGSRELLARFFLARVVTIVGVEAIRLYSGRSPGAEIGRLYELAWEEIRHLTVDAPHLEGKALTYFLSLVLRDRELSETTKLTLIGQAARAREAHHGMGGTLSVRESRQVERWLRRFIRQALPQAEQPAKLQDVHRRLAERTLPET